MNVSENNRRIAKNTLALYVRMGVSMIVSLFTSRVVLQTLGVEDFGIYNVVGGVVVLFSFLNAAMSSATQRFLNFELGRKDFAQVGRVFSMSMSVHFAIAGAVLLLAETLGLWFLNTQLNIPAERMAAANWVYQFSVASTLLGIMLVPYNATIIAYERMTFYAWASIATTFLRLGIVYLLVIGNTDKLVLYAALTFAVGVLMQIVHVVYCRRAFPRTAIYRPFRDKKLFRELVSFSGWSLFGGVANMANSQGINMVMNIFCGVAVNAAMGIANLVNGAIYQFVSNFQTAFNPQLVKSYAAGESSRFIGLIFRTSKFSYFLTLFLVLPVSLNADFILSAWLGSVPDYSVEFVQLTLAYSLISSLSAPLWMSVQATGKIRNYQLIVSIFITLNLPLAYAVLFWGLSPVFALAIRVGMNVVTTLWRVFYLRGKIAFPAWKYLSEVGWKVLLVTISSTGGTALVFSLITHSEWIRLCTSGLASFLFVGLFIRIFGIDAEERRFFSEILRGKLPFLRKKTIKN